MSTAAIIEKWYRCLAFPAEFDAEFYPLLKKIEIPATLRIDGFSGDRNDGQRNLLSYLYLCEELSQRYTSRGIDEDVLFATLDEVVAHTRMFTKLKGKLWLEELDWLQFPFGMTLFKLGPIQFRMADAERDIPEKAIRKGDPMIEVHIQEGAAIDRTSILHSLERAQEFFALYEPEYRYRGISLYSWLLDPCLKDMLRSDSNILRLQEMFDIVHADESDAILQYIFTWTTTRENIGEVPCTTSLQRKVRARADAGLPFHECLGILKNL